MFSRRGGGRISRCTPQLAAFVLGMDLVYEMPRESATERANEIEWYITSSSMPVDGSSLLRGFGTYQACYDDSPCHVPTIGLQITSFIYFIITAQCLPWHIKANPQT